MIKPPIFDVSGAHGASGKRGSSGINSGRDGDHGGKGEDGKYAGNISMRLATPLTTTIPKNVVLAHPVDAVVKIDAYFLHATEQLEKMDTILRIKPGEPMCFHALGGNGGRGGDGGSGGKGTTGMRGKDATRYKVGTNGGGGGRGGDGGNAGRGGDGGSGGRIRISVFKADTHLLMLLGTIENASGKRGLAGRRGSGGAGGDGGPGGSEYRWDEGEGENITHHVKQGGRRGPDGPRGTDGLESVPGQDGQDGTFCMQVLDGETDLKYDRIFNLNLLKFQLAPVKQDGIIEPGCRVLVSSIEIRNIGGMPTPRGVLAYIKPDDCGPAILNRPSWVVSEGYHRFVQLPLGLEPDVTSVVQCATVNTKLDGKFAPEINAAGEYLAFCVAPVDPVLALSTLPDRHLRGEAFAVTTSLTIRAQMTPFGRDFGDFVNPMPFAITYPVKMSPVNSLPSLLPGESTFVKFSVSNVSTREYGQDSEIGRVVIIKATYTGGNLHASKVQFNPIVNGNPTSPIALNQPTADKAQILWPITRLSAGETSNLSGRLSLLEDAEPFTTADFSVDLLLGKINNPKNAIRIQQRQMSVSASTVYKKTPNSGTLLVVNQQTTREELKAWKELAEFIFGDENPAGVVDVWDISQEGDFDLNSVLKSGSTLIKDWRSCTIVVLDNPFDNFRTRTAANRGQDDSALQYVDPDQLAEAVSNGTHFCVVSPLLEKSAVQRQDLVAPIDFTSSMAFETVRHLLDPFAIEPTSIVVYGHSRNFVAAEVDVRVDYTHVEQIILVERSEPLGVPELAGKLRTELLRKYPERRYFFSVCNAQEIGQVLRQAGRRIPPGTQAAIRVRRLLDVSSLSSRITLTAAPASPVDKKALSPNAATIHTPAFIKSPQVTSAFVQSIPYACRIALYVEVLRTLDSSPSTNEERRAGVLGASLLVDLACEQEMLRLKKRNHALTEDCFMPLLPQLSAFCQIDLPVMPVDSRGGYHLLDLLAKLKAYMASRSFCCQIVFFGCCSSRVTKVSNNLINSLLSRIFFSKSMAKRHISGASFTTLKKWDNDSTPLNRSGISNQPVTLKERAFAALLGSVACRKIKCSFAGSVYTEFSMLSTASDGSGLGPINHYRDSVRVTDSSSMRKAMIKSRSTHNKRLTSDFTPNGSRLSDVVHEENDGRE